MRLPNLLTSSLAAISLATANAQSPGDVADAIKSVKDKFPAKVAPAAIEAIDALVLLAQDGINPAEKVLMAQKMNAIISNSSNSPELIAQARNVLSLLDGINNTEILEDAAPQAAAPQAAAPQAAAPQAAAPQAAAPQAAAPQAAAPQAAAPQAAAPTDVVSAIGSFDKKDKVWGGEVGNKWEKKDFKTYEQYEVGVGMLSGRKINVYSTNPGLTVIKFFSRGKDAGSLKLETWGKLENKEIPEHDACLIIVYRKKDADWVKNPEVFIKKVK